MKHSAPLPGTSGERECFGCRATRHVVLFPKFGGDYCQLCVERRVQRPRKVAAAPHATAMARKALSLWYAAQRRAMLKELPFTLSQRWIMEALVAGRCHVTGVEFAEWGGTRRNFTPSIDRVDPALGYTDENCRMVVWIYNAAKGTGTHDDVVTLAKALVRSAAGRPRLTLVS